ncbi:MAG: histidinol dehydrogenase, partial [Mucispirillum sp.]|nr:histidinol dehydrogenase [Mucispirillum sp.]
MIINKHDKKLEEIKNRGAVMEGDYLHIASDIISNVRKDGDKALFEYTKKFDNFDINKDNIKVSRQEIEEAYNNSNKKLIESIKKAHKNILAFHKLQMEKTWLIETETGAMLGQKITPLDSCGIYVPGGKAAYFSSVLMNALPAVAAGVKHISMASPAVNGKINSAVLAAADICGIKDIYKIGGAQAIAALAYGTESVKKVDKITGPGNIYVAMAKKLVFGVCDIDMIAGPSEILIIAGDNAEAKYVAADMLAQCEHDELASAVTIVWNKELAEKIEKEVYAQLEVLPK